MACGPDINEAARWPHHINITQTSKVTCPYSPSIASTASSSSDSVFSVDAPSSQSSASSDSWSSSSDRSSWISETEDTYFRSRDSLVQPAEEFVSTIVSAYGAANIVPPIPSESRQHPRRTQRLNSSESQDGKSGIPCVRPPPSLVRQSDRKDNFVDSLVGKLT